MVIAGHFLDEASGLDTNRRGNPIWLSVAAGYVSRVSNLTTQRHM
jgi:hypothetical protein